MAWFEAVQRDGPRFSVLLESFAKEFFASGLVACAAAEMLKPRH
jgi:hypothetical protein